MITGLSLKAIWATTLPFPSSPKNPPTMIVQLIVFHVVLVEFQNKLSLTRTGRHRGRGRAKKSRSSEAPDERFHSSQGGSEILAGDGIRTPEVVLAPGTEHAARNNGHPLFPEQPLGKLDIRKPGLFYRRERVKGAFRGVTGQADPVQPGNEHIATEAV